MRVLRFLGLSGVLALLAGCLSSAPSPKSWSFSLPAAPAASDHKASLFGATRLGGVSVLPPYDQALFSVRREDGSVAFDPANRFAAPPAALLKGPLMEYLSQDGRFGHVVPQNSVLAVDAVVEIVIPELALDCSASAARKARAVVQINVIRNDRRRDMALSGRGSADVDATDGDFSAAFGAAVGAAVGNALSELK